MDIAFLVCLGLLVAFSGAMIFDCPRNFRRFVLHQGPEGKGKLANLFSIQGGVLWVMVLTIAAGVCLPLWVYATATPPADRQAQIISDLQARVAELKVEVDRPPEPDEILDIIESWPPNEPAADHIARIVRGGEGPWEPPVSEELAVSVPGTMEEGLAKGCRFHYEKRLELFGPTRDSVFVDVRELMFSAADCRDQAGIDLELSCADAYQLYGDPVLRCDGLTPRWVEAANPPLTVRAVEAD